MKTFITEPETRALLASGKSPGWQVVSTWIADLILEYERTIGFPFLRAVQKWIQEREGWPITEGGALSDLIYTAGTHNELTAPARAGFVPLTAEMLATGRKLLVYGGLLGDVECRPGTHDGVPVAFIGRSRTRIYRMGTMAKLKPIGGEVTK
jgi:hypothetical protein